MFGIRDFETSHICIISQTYYTVIKGSLVNNIRVFLSNLIQQVTFLELTIVA